MCRGFSGHCSTSEAMAISDGSSIPAAKNLNQNLVVRATTGGWHGVFGFDVGN
jgi:hypothetical protein